MLPLLLVCCLRSPADGPASFPNAPTGSPAVPSLPQSYLKTGGAALASPSLRERLLIEVRLTE